MLLCYSTWCLGLYWVWRRLFYITFVTVSYKSYNIFNIWLVKVRVIVVLNVLFTILNGCYSLNFSWLEYWCELIIVIYWPKVSPRSCEGKKVKASGLVEPFLRVTSSYFPLNLQKKDPSILSKSKKKATYALKTMSKSAAMKISTRKMPVQIMVNWIRSNANIITSKIMRMEKFNHENSKTWREKNEHKNKMEIQPNMKL